MEMFRQPLANIYNPLTGTEISSDDEIASNYGMHHFDLDLFAECLCCRAKFPKELAT
jgi:hypothetical protein